jgi:hypothetical protein
VCRVESLGLGWRAGNSWIVIWVSWSARVGRGFEMGTLTWTSLILVWTTFWEGVG